nr:putative elongation of fatty acids protein [Quercus suber]
MAIGCTLSSLTLTHPPNYDYIICFPPNTSPSGPLFFWAYIFYLSKILEFGDTLLIILTNSIQRLTFLHVYHHATVLIMCYLWLHTSQSLFPVALITNALVHLLCDFGSDVVSPLYRLRVLRDLGKKMMMGPGPKDKGS